MDDLTPVYEALRKADAAGNVEDAKQLAAYIRSHSTSSQSPAPVNAATDFGGDTLQVGPFDTHIPISQGVQNALAGAGKATMDLARGTGQLLGLESRADVADARKRDADLMGTRAGKAGFITGMGVDLLPTALIPGAGGLRAASAIGALTGLAQPSTSTLETGENALLGGVLGPLGILGGRTLGALTKGGMAAVEPFLPGGAQRIATRTLQSFAGGPAAAKAAASELASPPAVLPGIKPTMGELTSNAGLAQLQRTLSNNPETIATLAARQQANQGVVSQAIRNIAGTDAQREAAQTARDAVAKPLYQAAQGEEVQADDALRSLLSRPSMKDAWARAAQLADERGESLVSGKDVPEATEHSAVLDASGKPFTTLRPAENAKYSGRALQYLKMALQDTANSGPQRGMGAHELNAVRSTLGGLQDWITQNVPALRAADQAFAAGSRPLNQMDIGTMLRERLEPALTDFQRTPTRVNAQSFAKALRDGDDLAAKVTGNKRATLERTLSPVQLKTLSLIGQQLGRRATAADLGRAVGSNTAQNLAGQNLVSQFLGPFGLPQSMLGRAAQSVLARSLVRPYGFVARAAEPDIQQVLAKAALDPRLAAKMLTAAPPKALLDLWSRQGLLGPLANTAGIGYMQSGDATQK